MSKGEKPPRVHIEESDRRGPHAERRDPEVSSGSISKLTQLLGLYLVYTFLSGWTFFDFYFREFGVDIRWLDLPMQEALARSFRILISGGYWTAPVFAAMIVVPLAIDSVPRLHRSVLGNIVSGLALLIILLAMYFTSRQAAISTAKRDKGADTTLTTVTFSLKSCLEERRRAGEASLPGSAPCDYTGNLLIVRGGSYYVHKVHRIHDKEPPSLGLSVFRADELTDVTLLGY